MECKRCGGCCIDAPCAITRIRNKLPRVYPVCPELIKNIDGTYTCRIVEAGWANDVLLVGIGCTFPEYRRSV